MAGARGGEEERRRGGGEEEGKGEEEAPGRVQGRIQTIPSR